jgi:hypothetical protein
MTAQRFEEAWTLDDFVARAKENAELWATTTRRAAVDDDARVRAVGIAERVHVYVLLADWCTDALGSIPWIARLVEAMPDATLRCMDRDQALDVMDAHLTGTARSIPVVLLYDAEFRELGWWGPRPMALHEWVIGEGQRVDKDERNRHKRAWFARDRGRSSVEEVLALLERATGRG